MDILGNVVGGIFLVAAILWLVVVVASFFGAFVSIAMLLMQVVRARLISRAERDTGLQKLAQSYDDLGAVFLDPRHAKWRRILAISGSVYVLSLLAGIVVMLVAKKLHG